LFVLNREREINVYVVEDLLITYLIGAMGFNVCAGTGLEKATLAAVAVAERALVEELNSLSPSVSMKNIPIVDNDLPVRCKTQLFLIVTHHFEYDWFRSKIVEKRSCENNIELRTNIEQMEKTMANSHSARERSREEVLVCLDSSMVRSSRLLDVDEEN
jgi:CRISPR/Cas system CMR subunit Cmr4 (Cas7 group RAMP superfamily)